MRKVLFILGQLKDEDIEWMISAGKKERLAANAVLVTKGEEVKNLYIVLSGSFNVCASNGKVVATLLNGEIVGEMSFVEAAPPNVSVIAKEDSTVLAIPHSSFHRYMEREPAFEARMYKSIALFLSDRLRSLMLQMDPDSGNVKNELDEDELDLEVLGRVHVAGERFDRIMKMMRGQ